jgi:hypothetical protein
MILNIDIESSECADKLWSHFVCQNVEKMSWLAQTENVKVIGIYVELEHVEMINEDI